MALDEDEIKALDRLRTRLSQLSTNLARTIQTLAVSDPLPSWHDLRAQHESLLLALNGIQQILSDNREFFSTAHSYPHSTFPGNTQEGLLGLVMRKKLEVKSQDWVLKYTSKSWPDEDIHKYEDVWSSALEKQRELQDMFDRGLWKDDFTIKERQEGISSVKTGLRRMLGLEEESDEDEEGDEGDEGDEDEEMEEDVVAEDTAPPTAPAQGQPGVDAGRQPLAIEGVLRFLTVGTMPPQR